MKTIDELKRLYREIIDLNEQKKRLVRQFVVELFNTDGYEVLFKRKFYKDCSVDYLLENTSTELYADEIYFLGRDDDMVLSISFLSSLEEQIKEEKEYLERVTKAKEIEVRERELEELKRLKEKYENKE